MRELVPLGVVASTSLPTFLSTWPHEGNLCMFTRSQLKTWDNDALLQCPWILDCPLSFYLPKEKLERSRARLSQTQDDTYVFDGDTQVILVPS